MSLYEIREDDLSAVPRFAFGDAGVYERRDLQRLLRDYIEVIAPNTMVIAEEFGKWEDSKRRIDLLGLDTDANIIVIELKRDETGAHMELQALRYAAMVSKMTFNQAVESLAAFKQCSDEDAENQILEFLKWDEPDEELFGANVRIVLAAAEFSKELATSVIWLNERELDIRCVRMSPYKLEDRLVIDVQQVIPLPEAEEYQIKIREKSDKIRETQQSKRDFTRYDVDIGDLRLLRVAKRKVIFNVVRQIIRSGAATPEEIGNRIDWRSVWAVADGEFTDEDEFRAAAEAQYAAKKRTLDAPRFFIADDDLFVHEGKTYAFTKMWSGNDMLKAVDLLAAAYPSIPIRYEAAT